METELSNATMTASSSNIDITTNRAVTDNSASNVLVDGELAIVGWHSQFKNT